MGGACSTQGRDEDTYNILVVKTEGKRPLGRDGRRWEDTRMDLRGTEWEGVDWIRPAQDNGPVAGSCDRGNESSGSINGREFLY